MTTDWTSTAIAKRRAQGRTSTVRYQHLLHAYRVCPVDDQRHAHMLAACRVIRQALSHVTYDRPIR